FRKLASGPATAAPTVSYAPLTLVPAAAASLPVSGALASVATIFAGDGWGSGFLISPEGFLLTNRHVVGDARQVRVRWSDGSETVGDVTRSDARRDVALVKADPHGRGALPLRLDEAQPGEAVVAIGTPLEKTFQSTVTKGVISGIRTLEGLAFVQSDVAVDHGNSGGPLLDEHGRVLAITDWGYAPDGVSHNLNFFIPIDDALRALALTETAEPMGAVPPSARVSARRTR
ncbi:MAG TPA: trypsin-like peptidase domain-containing protein, partial [Phenylobacterium sp.]|uniref:S1C family serine protease n=1 Tax=Phenylobacterium sp. TaxID=1871053 RepID=UPI002CD6B123